VVITKFRELEKIILSDGWQLKSCVGSHFQYVHSTKIGKVTIPSHRGDIPKAVVSSVLKQAGLK
jgi:predicted RNA binding protein YcfA (HicA-like mRNA interferase family)